MEAGGAGSSAPVLESATTVTTATVPPSPSEEELRARLEEEVGEIVAAGHLMPSVGYDFGHHSRVYDDYLGHYWHSPADIHVVLLRALPFLSEALQGRVKAYLETELADYSPAAYAHNGFTDGTPRDPYPYPPAETIFRTFPVPTLGKQTASSSQAWGFPPQNVYALWKIAEAGLADPATLLSDWGTHLQAPITANNAQLTDLYLQGFPGVHNAYIAGYQGYVGLARLAGRDESEIAPYAAELDRLLALRVAQLMTFPNPQEPFTCENECYYESLITYHNFAHMTPELAAYLKEHAETTMLEIIATYQTIAPYWMMAHNGETQGEFTVMPYQQTHSLFQALGRIKGASRQALSRLLDTPIVPVGDLYYIDNLVATLEAPVDPMDVGPMDGGTGTEGGTGADGGAGGSGSSGDGGCSCRIDRGSARSGPGSAAPVLCGLGLVALVGIRRRRSSPSNRA